MDGWQDSQENAPLEVNNLLFIVTGAHLRAETADRPLAYQLADRIRNWVQTNRKDLTLLFVPVVCSDIWYVNDKTLQNRPTISIGGPGVNALSAYFAQKLDQAFIRDNQVIIQLDPEFVDLRVCIWGVNHEQTIHALSVFDEKYLDGYLRAVATQVEPRVD